MGELTDIYKPKYLQLYEVIKQEIILGKYEKGEKLPSENELIAEYNVSSITVRKCIDILKNDGLIERVQGLGTFVKDQPKETYNAEGFIFGISIQNSHNEWNEEVGHGLQSVIEAAGGKIFTSDALGDRKKQVEDLLNIVSKKPDLIFLLACDQQIHKNDMNYIKDSGIPIISIESYIEAPNIKSHLFADQMINGIYNANNIVDYLAILNNGSIRGNVILVYNEGIETCEMRYHATVSKLNTFKDIKILETINIDLRNPIEDCKNKLITYLKGHDQKVDVISVLGGEMIIGSIQALKELGSEKRIKVIGIDAFMPVIKLMKEDEPVIACVQQDGYALGTTAAKVGMKVVANEEVSYQYILPLTNVYANFPNKVDNYPVNGKVQIPCPSHLKEIGFDWGY